ncbi:phage integrase [Solimicrobium silvestre]|nr:tyrosine-type recombinase/integrase [Solimicrobium silvestre]
MLRRTKTLASGKVWESFYYNGRDESGKRKEIPLGNDINEAKRKWAEFESVPVADDVKIMRVIFNRYVKDIFPMKAARTQKDNGHEIKQLRAVFDSAPIDAITPQHIAQYRDKRTAKVRANRELALLSHVFNMAREWGYTAKENPCRGIRKNKEVPRDFYADAEVWDAVYACAKEELKDAMDIAYLTGQRPADVLKMRLADINASAISVKQNKTGKFLRILLNDEFGNRSALGQTIDAIRRRDKKVLSLSPIALPNGQPMNAYTLRTRFESSREQAAKTAKETNPELSERIKKFQFRDIRPKAASEIKDLGDASKLLGHTDKQITETVYRRVGESVKPTK